MMKKFLFLLVAMLGMTLQGGAQPPFSDKKPPFRRFVKVLHTDVNLHQAPTTQSPRLIIHSEENEIGDWWEEYYWSNRPLKKNESAAHATVLPIWEPYVMSSVKTANGWICGYFEEKMVYIMEKFCKEVPLRPLSASDKNRPFNITMIRSGKYKNYCLAKRENSIGETYLNIGKYVDGMFIFNYDFYYMQSEDGGTSFDDNILRYGRNLSDSNGYLDINKLINDTFYFSLLMNTVQKITNYCPVTYYGIEGDNKWYTITGIY